MPSNTRITDLTDYTSVLPYASELFGVYQPMIGWRSARQLRWLNQGNSDAQGGLRRKLLGQYEANVSEMSFLPATCEADIGTLGIGSLPAARLIRGGSSQLLKALAVNLPPAPPPDEDWEHFINPARLSELLNSSVKAYYLEKFREQCSQLHQRANEVGAQALATDMATQVRQESSLSGALVDLVTQKQFGPLRGLFYVEPAASMQVSAGILKALQNDDVFAHFDPNHDIGQVSLSPIGIVHLFRQFFFELDSFLGTPVGHVWLSPGSMVELIEISTRRTYVEQTIEQSTETTQRRETSETDQDEISEAVKTDNKNDLKLGASVTVNQSWGTGSATATGSFNLDTTQGIARDTSHKRMREQSAKLSSEIKQNYKSTFKTINETIDTSSKRYVLNNTTQDLINYELRRKMRQVGVQVQDVGTYLCWETFVDEPGKDLGLANLVNIAKPADLAPPPAQSVQQYPPDKTASFTGSLVWAFDDPMYNDPIGFKPLGGIALPPAPDGYELKYPGSYVDLVQVSGSGDNFSGTWAFRGKLVDAANVTAGVDIGPGGLDWSDRVDFVIGGSVAYAPTAAAKQAIDTANRANAEAVSAATLANERKTREAFLDAAKSRIEAASIIDIRKYEDLREEERIIVYRRLVSSLMSDSLYNLAESPGNDRLRHAAAELLNSIFDIDKMLYFVAPEWWKPRQHSHQYLAQASNEAIFEDNLTNWADNETRPDNYFITEKTKAARMGSSLGWLLQLDGDDLRNAFLNAPWVKAVIPVRPGKEADAANWLKAVNVEGTDGLDAAYSAPEDELAEIRADQGVTTVTIADAIAFLCQKVAAKHAASLQVGRYPDEEINDDNRVSATPVDKVYEHGFYPLQGGFRAKTTEPFEVFDQWVEVVPTDQVVPVEVAYNPKTGRQLP